MDQAQQQQLQQKKTELRQVDITVLAEQTRDQWQQMQKFVPAEHRDLFAPYIETLTDTGYLREKARTIA